MYTDIIVMIIKTFYLNFMNGYVFFRIINERNITFAKILKIIFVSVISTIIYVLASQQLDHVLVIIFEFIFETLLIKMMVGDKIKSITSKNLISNSIVYILFVASMILEYPFIILLNLKKIIINLLLMIIIETILIILFFKIKRFNQGISFLTQKSDNDYLNIIITSISSIIILVYCLFGNHYGEMTKSIFLAFIIVSIIMIIMIQKTLTLYYKQKLLHQTIEDYKNEIAEKDKKIKELSDEKYKISKLNHEFYNRQKALEKKVADYVSNINMEAGTELAITDKISELSKEYTSKLQNIKHPDKLPTTEIEEIDDMFKYMQSECEKNKIEFKLEINGNIHHMINKIIPKDKLVTLIGDHLRDAIIAINASDNKFKSIIAILGKTNEYYEFCVLDTGIEFEVETLLQLGTKPITTHKDIGGTGYGFMTTFETLKSTKGSLEIEEKHKMNENDYTKAVRIIFDGKAQYRIKSYRLGTKEKSIL